MSKATKTIDDLQVGKRYWLDPIKDVSGVLKGIENGNILFGDLEGAIGWYASEEHPVHGKVYPFSNPAGFYLVE